ncbi:MAG: prepilin-type N-terminal cleavage/methylation domain-containing protein [Nitrospira sp.]|nr:prepilin-type N-terminal cleavage/methylation domain-containing protein [bacterium]MBL7049538.1 prepilin-type N-terminal cleavage/methylation domain-containing protein [Nitrospira sp.]
MRQTLQTLIRNRGFTLIELMIVLFIIALASAVALPSFYNMGRDTLKSDAKRLGSTLRYVYDESTSRKSTFSILFNLDEHTWQYEGTNDSKAYSTGKGIFFDDIEVPSLGKVSRGELVLLFNPLGPEEPISIHLRKEDSEYTVKFNHISGRVRIYEGRNE